MSDFVRYTRANHRSHPSIKATYRLPTCASEILKKSKEHRFRIKANLVRCEGIFSPCLFGDAIDRLGEYEDTGKTPSEIKEILTKFCD